MEEENEIPDSIFKLAMLDLICKKLEITALEIGKKAKEILEINET